MPYQSPLHILDDLELSSDQINPEGLNRLRKKLLAEFSLNPAVTIDIKGKAYTKDEILKTIDSLKETDNLAGHQYIFQNKNLLNWLENPTQVVMMPSAELKNLIAEKSEDSFLLDRIESALYDKIKVSVRKRNFKATESPMSIVEALPFYHSIVIYDFLYGELQSIIESIEAARETPNMTEDKKTFGFITFSDWTDLLNNLPDDFEGARDDYCRSAVNYSVGVQKKDKKWVFNISQQLIKTQCDESLTGVINDNHKIYADNYSGSGITDWGWVRLVLFVLFIIARMSSCSKNSSSTSQIYSIDELTAVKEQQDTTAIIFPASTFYVLRVQAYQEAISKINKQKTHFKEQPQTGNDPTPLLNTDNIDETTNTKANIRDSSLVAFINNSGLDVLVFKAGLVNNRSYFINDQDRFTVACSPNDILYFYFGSNWHKALTGILPITSKQDKTKPNASLVPISGYFATTTSTTEAIFNNESEIKSVSADAQIIFTPEMVTKTGTPTLKNISLLSTYQ